MTIDQTRAEHLLQLEKYRVDTTAWIYPRSGERIEVPLVSRVEREEFILDVRKSQIAMKATQQMRFEKTTILARLDLLGAHRNPDGILIPAPHLHLYRDGYNDKWAFPLPEGLCTDPSNLLQTLHEFMDYCRVVERPVINASML